MFDIWLRLVKIIKNLSFKTKEESNIFSKHFSIRKWSSFILLLFFLTTSIFLTYKLFVISSRYIILNREYKALDIKYKDKSIITEKLYKYYLDDVRINNKQNKILDNIDNKISSDDLNSKKMSTYTTNMIQLISLDNEFLSRNLNALKIVNKELNTLMEIKK